MALHIHIQKKHVYIFVAVAVLLLGVVFVRGFGSGDPNFHGHDSGELIEDDPQVGDITAGEVCFTAGSQVTCNDTDFSWDAVNGRLAIGGVTPSVPLHIIGEGGSALGEIFIQDNTGRAGIQFKVGSNNAVIAQDGNFLKLDSSPLISLTNPAIRIHGATRKVGIGEMLDATLTSTNLPSGSLVLGKGALCVDNGNDNCDDTLRTAGRIYAVATSVQAIDLAENIPTSEELEPGDVVCIDTTQTEKVKLCDQDKSTLVAGVVSTEPGLLLGLDLPNSAPITLAGRVPVKVEGDIAIGDLLVSTASGKARACHQDCTGAIVGKSLEASNGQGGKVIALVTLQ